MRDPATLELCFAGHVERAALRARRHIEQVGAAIARYNLLALPVVDDEGALLGIVTVDDAFERALGEGWRKRLPEIFEPADDR